MIKLALLGKNISHSKSPEIYKNLIAQKFTYDLIDCQEFKDVPSLLELSNKYSGINITAPYKKYFFNEVQLDQAALRVSAINCIRFVDETAIGTNTDFDAFKKIFLAKNFQNNFEIIILGDGAMANMVRVALNDFEINVKQFSRKNDGELNKIDYNSFVSDDGRGKLLINCCSREFLFNPQNWNKKSNQSWTFFDLNYSHENQKSLCLTHGFSYYDGEEMLLEQARLALQFWSII